MKTSLEHRVSHWLFLRLATTTLVLAASVVLFVLAVDGAQVLPLAGCVVLEALVTLAGAWALHRGFWVRRVQAFQLVVDVLVIAAIVHWTGGLESRFHLLYFFPLLFGAYALEQKGALYVGGFAAAVNLGYTLLVAAERLTPPHFVVRGGIVDNGGLIGAHLIVTLLLVVGYLAGEIAGRIRRHERELAEKSTELADMERETTTILDNMGSGVITVDRKGVVQRMNPAAEHIFGMGSVALVGARITDGLADMMPVFVGTVMECAMDEVSSNRMEVNIERQDGSVIPVGLSVNPMHDRDGATIGAVAVFQDLSDVTRMREQVRQQDRLAAMGELSAVIAHEIRNPLASIRGSVEMLEGELKLDAESGHLFGLIRNESARLNRMIEDFLDYARLKHAQPRNCRATDLVEQLRELLENRDDLDLDRRFEMTAPPDDLVVRVDEELIRQVFLNLALNAYQAMGAEGALTVSVGLQPRVRPPAVVFRFSDEGPGMDEESLSRIFEPFFTTRKGGTGLGLPLANRIISGHDGKIEAHNLDGGGAQFSIYLPLVGIRREGTLMKGEELQEAMERIVAASQQELDALNT